jgi:hypothetical protein
MEVTIMERRPFHEVILEMMEQEEKALKDTITFDDSRMRLLGSIFVKAILPKDKRSEIVKKLRDMGKNLRGISPSTGGWLESIAEDVGE